MKSATPLPLCTLVAVLITCGAEPGSTGAHSTGEEATAFTLERATLAVGDGPLVTFDRPLPPEGERYWITVIRASEPDSGWGAWQYVDSGVTQVKLAALTAAGRYEVRLHAHYPEHSYDVVNRASLTVEQGPAVAPSTTPVATPEAAAPGAVEPTAPEPATPEAATGDNPFDQVSFKSEAEVLTLVGEPAAKLVEEDRIRWYYEDQFLNRFGEMACPELHFMDGEVRSVVYYPPSIMKDHIETARLLGGVAYKPPQGPRARTFSFAEAFDLASGKSKSDILGSFGEPTSKRIQEGSEIWQYDDLVVEAESRHLLAIRFEGDIAADVQGM